MQNKLNVFATITFGQYKGLTIKQLLKTNPQYLLFLRNKKGFKFDNYVDKLLDTYKQT
jgi:hypothetical protein